jgi:hypothetical protein
MNGGSSTTAAASPFHASFATGGYSRYSAIVSLSHRHGSPRTKRGETTWDRAAGEEPAARRPMLVGGLCLGRGAYTLRLLWDLKTGAAARLSIVATDIDDAVLARARKGCYPVASLRELPPDLVARGFEEGGHLFRILEQHRRDITFMHHDLRSDAIPGFFDLILCRNLAFTYFAPRLQCQVLERLAERLLPKGWLVIGAHERLPDEAAPDWHRSPPHRISWKEFRPLATTAIELTTQVASAQTTATMGHDRHCDLGADRVCSNLCERTGLLQRRRRPARAK